VIVAADPILQLVEWPCAFKEIARNYVKVVGDELLPAAATATRIAHGNASTHISFPKTIIVFERVILATAQAS